MVDIAAWERDTIIQEESAHLQRLARRWRVYNQGLPDTMQLIEDQPNDNVKVNKCREIVVAGVSFLFGKNIRFELDETQTTKQEQYLDQVWQANRQMTLLQKVATNGGVSGHAFIKLEPASPITGGLPRLINLDPLNVWPLCENDDTDDIYAWKIQFNAVETRTGKPIVMRERYIRSGDKRSWQIIDDFSYTASQVTSAVPLMTTSTRWIETHRTTWAYSWAPIFHCQNYPCPNEFWGESDIPDDVIHLNQQKNLNLSLSMRHQVFRGFPQVWGNDLGSSDLQEYGPLNILNLPQGASLNVLQTQSDAVLSQWLDNTVTRSLHELAQVPEIATGKVENTGQLSGVALRVLYQPLLARTETKRQTYGEMLTEINRRLLELKGLGDGVTPRVKWQDPLPTDLLQMAQASVLRQQFGYSNETLIAENGGDPDLERSNIRNEAQSLGTNIIRQFDAGGVPVDTNEPG